MMKILQKIYNQLIHCPMVPPECGGIIGSDHRDIITHVIIDKGKPPPEDGIMYIPNTLFLNQAIEEWEKSGIKFLGIFHTHASQWPRLSNNDKVQIAAYYGQFCGAKRPQCGAERPGFLLI